MLIVIIHITRIRIYYNVPKSHVKFCRLAMDLMHD